MTLHQRVTLSVLAVIVPGLIILAILPQVFENYNLQYSSVLTVLYLALLVLILLKITHSMISKPLNALFDSVHAHDLCPQELTRRSDEIGRIARLMNNCLKQRDLHQMAAERANSRVSTELYRVARNHKLQVINLQKDATTDELTRLANRARLEQEGPQLFDQARKQDIDLSVMMIDVDKFKQINDSLGHDVGDKVIAFMGEILRGCTRPVDLSARFGGDEFVIILKGCSLKSSAAIAERMRKLFEREVLQIINPTGKKLDFQPGLSIGIASLKRSKVSQFTTLCKLADKALYRAKEGGRNRVAI